MVTAADVRTAPPATVPPATVPPAAPTATAPRPTPGAILRAVGVVMGGPLLLDALEVLGPLSAAGRWPDRLQCARSRRAAWALTAVGVAAPVVDHGLVRPRLRRWGATPDERARRLPGDPDGRPLVTTTRAVTVRAPAEEVWPWLAQLGQDRGGFYSYDWLENLAGCRVHSAETIHPEWQERTTGDELTIFPGFATTLTEVDPPRTFLIANWGAYVVEPVDDDSCRLIARSHADRNAGGLMYVLLVELPHAIMERRTMLGIKARAERAARRRATG